MKLPWVFAYSLSLSLFQTRSWQGLLYEFGVYGPYFRQVYYSFELMSPRINTVKWSPQCSSDYVLLTPHGWAVPTPGPTILDATGNLVWTEDRYGLAMDLQMQRYRGEDYLTFWAGSKAKGHGQGVYYMVSIIDIDGFLICTPASAIANRMNYLHQV